MAYRIVLGVLLASLAAGMGYAADQTILGKQAVLEDATPGTGMSHRKLVGAGQEKASPNTIVGEPTLNGGRLTFFGMGATPSSQSFPLPATLWRAVGTSGFKYKDTAGAAGPVKNVEIRRSSSGVFQVKALVLGRLGPVEVVPPNTGTEGCMLLELNGGDRYHVALGAGSVVKRNDARSFAIKDAPDEGLCPEPATTTTSTTVGNASTTSTTTTGATTTSTTLVCASMTGTWSGTFDGGSNHGTWSAVITESGGVFTGPATVTFATLGTCQHGGKFCNVVIPCAATDQCDLSHPYSPPAHISGSNECGVQPQLHFSFVEGGDAVFPNWTGNFFAQGSMASGFWSDNQDFGAGNWIGARQ